MPEREYVWTDEGLAHARRNGVAVDEATEALYAPPGLRYEQAIGNLLLIVMHDRQRSSHRRAVRPDRWHPDLQDHGDSCLAWRRPR